jgi:arylsulfatase A-like enzyme
MFNLETKQNIIVFVVDELRYPTLENQNDPVFKKFWDELRGYTAVKEMGLEFTNHYTNSTACTPARNCLYTAQHKNFTTISQTSGIAKSKNDPYLTWLDPTKTKNMGNYFKNLDYETIYVGKWHLSEEKEYETVNDKSERVLENEQKYKDECCLKRFGWDQWIGPEPHGARLQDSGYVRDPIFIDQALDYLSTRSKTKPYIMAINLVNPHDIVLYPKIVLDLTRDVEEDEELVYKTLFPTIPTSPDFNARTLNLRLPSTLCENLELKPKIQREYKHIYENNLFLPSHMFEEIFSNPLQELQFYCHCIKTVDEQLYRFITDYKTKFNDNNTWFIYTADHGDLMLDHGLRQKWHNAYNSTIHIPLIISHFNPTISTQFKYKTCNNLTQSVDIVPTILVLSNNKLTLTNNKLDVHDYPFHGHSLTPYLKNPTKQLHNVVYFSTSDEITKGSSQITLLAVFLEMDPTHFKYEHLKNNVHCEAIVFYSKKNLLKLVRYYNDIDNYSINDDFELYNLDYDPIESHNLYKSYDGTNELYYYKELLQKHSKNSYKSPVIPLNSKL